jgi:hypothetical protein
MVYTLISGQRQTAICIRRFSFTLYGKTKMAQARVKYADHAQTQDTQEYITRSKNMNRKDKVTSVGKKVKPVYT